jgi:hypothetical protein
MSATFTCDRCGRKWARERLKEVFREEDGREVKHRLCPECLDEVMNVADAVYGVSGKDKDRAAYVADRSRDMPARE